MKRYEFDAIIKRHEGMDASYILFPYDTNMEFGTKGRVKVLALFDDYEYRGSLANMGMEYHCLILVQKIRKEIGKTFGDTVHVIITKDEEPRVVELPEDLMRILEKHNEEKEFFIGLAYTHQKEYVTWIQSAKRPETREKRLTGTIEMLSKKIKESTV